MNTYKEVAKFMLNIIEIEGVLNAQNHIGTMRGINHEFDIERYFGGKIVESNATPGSEQRSDFVFYVYEDEDGFYQDKASQFFRDEDHLIVVDADGQRVNCWFISELR